MFQIIELPKGKYKTIYIDPPWEVETNTFKEHPAGNKLPYETMSIQEIKDLPIQSISEDDSHLWLWTTNFHLHNALNCIEKWEYKYLNVITWVKSSGLGTYFVSTTQHLLFAYNKKCLFLNDRFKPTHYITTKQPKKHSQKPLYFYPLIEGISQKPRIELFARYRREGWDVWGNEIPKETQMLLSQHKLSEAHTAKSTTEE